ncbi:putative nuclease HARBI1 [Mytilus trossulus]|uniref:putative nuclease HARBI1 n=1 Tax=Mytilus trossulus TaxID=6551 RepID=UPI0030048C3D
MIFRGMVSHLNNLTDNEMRIIYRFGRDSIAYICNIVDDKLRRSTAKKTALTVEQQVCIALRFYASGSFLQVIGDTMGYDKATVSRAVNDVTNALLDVKDNFIQWPKDINSKNRMKCGKFTNISANWPGSTHDSHIFNTSNLCHYLETNNRGLADGLILGDSGYACRPFLMTPYLNPRERHQQRLNRAHSSTRSITERAFGILKRRFHVLHSEVRMKPEKVCRVFGACAVLHTIALTRNEPLEDVCGVNVQQDQPVQVPNFEGEQDGRHIREHIARVFFN